MSATRPYHIPHKATTITTYWLLQWIGIVALVAAITAVIGDWTYVVHGAVSIVIGGTVWTAMIMAAQTVYTLAADRVGGRREVGKVCSGLSIATGVLCATGHCSLVIWLVIVLLAGASDGTASGPLAFLGCVGMICLVIFWTIVVRTFVREGRREERYTQLTKRLLTGTVLCGVVCGAVASVVAAVSGEIRVFFWIATVIGPWPAGATFALVGCLLYFKRLWAVRAPWYETHCAECGYDLSGNLAVSQCSECGTPWKQIAIVPAGSKRAAGRCEGCGYDMSGTPHAERCPECGAGWSVTPPDSSKT